jgi:putative PIN family toxin of toxin-antitoxin system
VKVFLDTNVLVSAFASRGICADIFELVLLEHDLLTGENVLRELGKALRQKIRLPAAVESEVVELVEGEVPAGIKDSAPLRAPVDDDDARVLGEATHGGADLFVTGDAALLKLGRLDRLQIVSPRQFWELLSIRVRRCRRVVGL